MKMKKLSVLLSGLALLLLMSVCPGCQKEFEIEVTMINGSSSDVHLWITGESIDPSNKLVPGSSRMARFTNKGKFENEEFAITVYAGQNGQVLTSKEFTRNSEVSLRVRYSGGTLVEE
ncbi:MAG: hypothetical protein GX646_12945 [Bacteroidales bacterium]|nr:hypothetical protein [Bacteroidales bacterium]